MYHLHRHMSLYNVNTNALDSLPDRSICTYAYVYKYKLASIKQFCCIIYQIFRGRCNELISYWLFIGIDKNQMAELYLSATQKLEGSKAINSTCNVNFIEFNQ